jgi:hypothetical protein
LLIKANLGIQAPARIEFSVGTTSGLPTIRPEPLRSLSTKPFMTEMGHPRLPIMLVAGNAE